MSSLIDLILPMLMFIGLFGGLVKFVEWGDREIDHPATEIWIPSHIDDEGVIEMYKE
jgi:hypothetical protein